MKKSDKGFCVWLMGLSASGKTTLAHLLKQALVRRGLEVELIDGDLVRSTINKKLGFTKVDRETNLRQIASMVKRLIRRQAVVVVAAICPYQHIREEMRDQIGEFIEVYLSCPLEICIRRDPKGLYKRALAGEIKNFTGIDDPFDVPEHPEILLNTDIESPEDSLSQILMGLESLNRILRGGVPEQFKDAE